MAFLKTKYLVAQALITLSWLVMANSVMAATVAPAPTVAVSGTVQSQCGQAVNGVMSINIDPSILSPSP